MSINLHLLNAQGKLSELENRIASEFKTAVNQITSLLPINDVDVVISASDQVLPETGLGGFCPEGGLIYLKIDPNNSNLLERFSEEFLATMGHEMHHCMRWRTAGYGSTLKEALITEGLACCFETELRSSGAPFYATALDKSELSEFWGKAKPELGSNSYDHVAWFFGSPTRRIPKHTGYSLGFSIVENYINRTNIPASRLSDVLASQVISEG
ncbi:DUF2268 domain-containing putative Zn-dependent protease [Vibrio parahaemolyticus]|uniref:DUF2268 domain-containing putative Zn-dependent protease n=1 Tax=Vibrio parahaemolyticus TaxID=670 RepID=UPI001122B71E|nr:DUF2268 domain-containing putative Zn-dependent protease [Vibrio parahaemolyticus]EKQ5902689.1 hypothetical protein [Vibrio parahaemolyticus]MDF4476238.1 DUF2268 domain-containing putative Zn-dependent protease [Vibrio parahaemolyticus]MDF4480753.1 DUF2268 domain-containing putative Zn-dependent protease [Vibrio parahaemolyticus]MDG3409147.1 DUF2268 domain-containing putative Zn-dependent protease [Vibrio parahaemolyticus]MUT64149.1 hypothetical protein [Vibrio parahaemolyticus]